MKLEWMAWTTPTAIFFVFVFGMLAVMTVMGIRWPSIKRKGFLPIETTRGDRLYIGLIVSAFINLIWLGFSDAMMWGAVGICAAWLFVVMRWG
jgi:predicted small integral membrane protein